MDALKLKSDLHKLIDEVQNAQLLQVVYDFLKSGNRQHSGSMWNELSAKQREEVFMAFEESENEYNLVKGKDAFKSS